MDKITKSALLFAAAGTGALIGAAAVYFYLEGKGERSQRLLQRQIDVLHQKVARIHNVLCDMGQEADTKSVKGVRLETNIDSDIEEEFYDLDDLNFTISSTTDHPPSTRYNDIDELFKGTDIDKLAAFEELQKLENSNSDDVEFLWRYAKAHQIKARILGANGDVKSKQRMIGIGLIYAEKALTLDSNLGDCHKWYAILIGMRSEYLSIKEKVQDGKLFAQHIDAALKAKPNDYSLYHLRGRFKLELCNLSWIEKKVASAIFGTLPETSYDEALSDFLKASDLNPEPWKENLLLLAEAYIGSKKYQEAMDSLSAAYDIPCKGADDKEVHMKINELILSTRIHIPNI